MRLGNSGRLATVVLLLSASTPLFGHTGPGIIHARQGLLLHLIVEHLPLLLPVLMVLLAIPAWRWINRNDR